MGFYVRPRALPGATALPAVAITEAQWRTYASLHYDDLDSLEAAMTPDTKWLTLSDIELWQSTPGTFNPTTTTVANASRKETHTRGDLTGRRTNR